MVDAMLGVHAAGPAGALGGGRDGRGAAGRHRGLPAGQEGALARSRALHEGVCTLRMPAMHGAFVAAVSVHALRCMPDAEDASPVQVLVDGWGCTVKEPEQLQWLERLRFVDFQARPVAAHSCLWGMPVALPMHEDLMESPAQMDIMHACMQNRVDLKSPEVTFRLIIASCSKQNGMPVTVRCCCP